MKMFQKSLLAVALLAGAGAANAALVTGSTTGGNSLFMSVYDSVQAKTYNLDLGVTFAQLVNNVQTPLADANAGLSTFVSTAATGLASYLGAGKDLSTDANWNAFTAGITNNANVSYFITTGSSADQSILFTASNTNAARMVPVDPTAVNAPGQASKIATHGNEINAGMATGANSSLINDLPATPFIGQMNHAGALAQEIWSSAPTGFNGLTTYGQSVGFWGTGVGVAMLDDGLGNIVATQVVTAQDIHNLGTFMLSGNSLAFAAPAPAAVPLPAAVWMFGAGLMGLLRVTRRKSA